MTRETDLTAFLKRIGWANAVRSPLTGDASNRRYERLTHHEGGKRAILMDAPPDRCGDVQPFVTIANLLHGHGLSPPEILAEKRNAGFLLLEDLGDTLFARVLEKTPEKETLFYTTAVDALVHLQAQPLPDIGIGPYDLPFYLIEAHIFSEWYLDMPHVPPAFEAAIRDILAPLLDDPPVLVLRDYHAENLIWLEDREGIARAGQLDFQDALIGHPAYDLVSLLEDARRDTTPELREAMTRHYLDRTGLDEGHFRFAMAALGAQRNLKILGIFARLLKRDGKPAYLHHMPRVWAHLQRDLTHPGLASLAAWMGDNAAELVTPEARP